MTDPAFREYVDKLIIYFKKKPDKEHIVISSRKQLRAIVFIIDGMFDHLNGFDLELSERCSMVRKINIYKK